MTCKTCHRPTWAGCGAHVEQVLDGVPASDRCQCRSGGTTVDGRRNDREVKDKAPVGAPRRSLLGRLRGR